MKYHDLKQWNLGFAGIVPGVVLHVNLTVLANPGKLFLILQFYTLVYEHISIYYFIFNILIG